MRRHCSCPPSRLKDLSVPRQGTRTLTYQTPTRIFLPLGMQTTSFFLAELKKVKQSDSGQQTKILHFAEPEGYGHYEVAEFPACQVRTTANDLLRF